MSESLKERLQQDMKAAMRAKDSTRLGVIRLINAAIKQREVDERISLDDNQVIEVLSKMLKQRRDSINQYQQAGRSDLVEVESFEVELIEHYLPPALSVDEISAIIDEVIAATGAASARDMGKVMAQLKPRLQGRADMGQLSAQVKQRLAGD